MSAVRPGSARSIPRPQPSEPPLSHKLQQFASTMQRAIAEVLVRGLGDPRVRGLVSVTRVEVDPDLRQARVFVSVLPEEHERLTLEGLVDAAPHIHRQIKGRMDTRAVPHLDFRLDTQLKKENATLAAIAKARRDDEAKQAEKGPGSGDQGPGTASKPPVQS